MAGKSTSNPPPHGTEPEVIGVYKLPLSLGLLRKLEASVALLYEGPWRWIEALRQHTRIICVEMWVDTTPEAFSIDWYCPSPPELRDSNSQVPYDEHWLTHDGGSVIEVRWPEFPRGPRCRVAFFLHEMGQGSRLWTPWSTNHLLTPRRRMPSRLRRIMRYDTP